MFLRQNSKVKLFVVWTCWSFGKVVDPVDGGVHWNWGEECLDIVRCHDLSWLKLGLFDMSYKILGIFKVRQGLTNQVIDNVGQFLGHSICDKTTYGRQLAWWVCLIYVFWVNHRTWEQLCWWDTVLDQMKYPQYGGSKSLS